MSFLVNTLPKPGRTRKSCNIIHVHTGTHVTYINRQKSHPSDSSGEVGLIPRYLSQTTTPYLSPSRDIHDNLDETIHNT